MPTVPTGSAAAAAAAGWTSSTVSAPIPRWTCRFSTATCLNSPGSRSILKLVVLAKHLKGRLVTNDYNLNKVARIQGVEVVNLNDLANALKPVFLPGEQFDVRVVKAGEEAGQGVGYLEDGTMVVIEGGREHIGKQVSIAVTSVLQTSAGRMVFGRCENNR